MNLSFYIHVSCSGIWRRIHPGYVRSSKCEKWDWMRREAGPGGPDNWTKPFGALRKALQLIYDLINKRWQQNAAKLWEMRPQMFHRITPNENQSKSKCFQQIWLSVRFTVEIRPLPKHGKHSMVEFSTKLGNDLTKCCDHQKEHHTRINRDIIDAVAYSTIRIASILIGIVCECTSNRASYINASIHIRIKKIIDFPWKMSSIVQSHRNIFYICIICNW